MKAKISVLSLLAVLWLLVSTPAQAAVICDNGLISGNKICANTLSGVASNGGTIIILLRHTGTQAPSNIRVTQTGGRDVSASLRTDVGDNWAFDIPRLRFPTTLTFRYQANIGFDLPGITVAFAGFRNTQPTSTRIEDRAVRAGSGVFTINLADFFSDLDTDDTLTYSISAALQGSGAAITTSVNPMTGVLTLTPSAVGTTRITASVRDAAPSHSSPTSQSFTVRVISADNAAPTTKSSAPTSQALVVGQSLFLDGALYFEDADGDTLTYTATSSDSAVTVTPTAGGVNVMGMSVGSSMINFQATDNNPLPVIGEGTAATVGTASRVVTVSVAANNAPTANAGDDQTVAEGAPVTLDGSGSSDPNGSALSYAWTQVLGSGGTPMVTLTGADTARPTFTAPTGLADDIELTFSLTVNDGTTNSQPDTVIITVTEGDAVQKTIDITNRFLGTRTSLILANQPGATRRITRLQQGAGTGQLAAQHYLSDALAAITPFDFDFFSLGSGNYNFATSLDQVTLAADSLQAQAGGTGAAEHTRHRFDVWFEGSRHEFNGHGDSSGTFGIAHLGADYLFSPDLLVGAKVQYDSMTESSDNLDYTIEGKGWMVGPYVAARLYDLYLDGHVAWGRSDDKISPYKTYTDDFTSERWLTDIGLSGDFSYENWNLRPNISLSYLEEGHESYVNTPGDIIPDQKVSRGQVRMGPNVSIRFVGPDGSIIEPSFTLDAIYSHERTNGVTVSDPTEPDNGWRARAEPGLTITTAEGLQIGITGNYDGIGQSDYSSWGVGLRGEILF